MPRVLFCAAQVLALLLLAGMGWAADPLVQENQTCTMESTPGFDCPSGACPAYCDKDMWACTYDDSTDSSTNSSSGTEVCDHVTLFSPYGDVGRDIGLAIVLFVFLTLASAGGIGGGGIVIPMLLVIGNFPTYYAVPLSVTAIFGGSIVRFVMLVRRNHPNPEVLRNLINFDLILLMLPTALAGTTLGVLINGISPGWLIITVIFVTLTFTSYKTVRKGIEISRKENEAAAAEESNKDTPANGKQSAATELVELNGVGAADTEKGPTTLEEVMELEAIVAQEAKFPWIPIAATFAQLIILIILGLIKGGRSGESFAGVQCGTPGYGGVIAAQWIFLVCCAVAGALYVYRKYQRKVAVGYKFVEGDVHFTKKVVIVYPCLAISVGFLAGFLGIGGGMVLGPLLLALQLNPMVSMATTSYMTLFTSSSSFAQFAVLDRIMWAYGGFLFGIAMIASFVGQYYIVGYIRKTGKNSYIAFILAFIIILATVLLCVLGIIQIIEDVQGGESLGFTPLCQ